MPAWPPHTSLVLTFDRGTLLLRGRGGRTAADASGGTWAWDGRVSAWRCEAIHYSRVHQDLVARFGQAFRDDVPRPARVFWPKVALPELRPEQSEALAGWTKAGCRGQVIMPTGTGKTELALAAMAQTRKAALVIAPIRDLIYQWHRRILKALGYDAGILGDNTYNARPVSFPLQQEFDHEREDSATRCVARGGRGR